MGLALDCNKLGHSRRPLTTIGRLYFYAHTTALSRLTNAGQLKGDSFPVHFPKKKVKARSLLRYWAVRAAEISLRTLYRWSSFSEQTQLIEAGTFLLLILNVRTNHRLIGSNR